MRTRRSSPSRRSRRRTRVVLAIVSGLSLAIATPAIAQTRDKGDKGDTIPRLEIYGFGQGDAIVDFRRNDPNWFDVNRPTKLPAFGSEFNANGNTYFSARQSRFGVKAITPTGGHGDVLSQFEFDMFGVGIDAGQTTIRLRLAYGQWGPIGGGQLWSPFMDIDVFPNILDYWGPNGMLFFRNVQVFYEPIKRGETSLRFALERPGATGDAGPFADRIQIQNIKPRFPWPDLSGGFRYGAAWGHVKIAGIVRDIHWEQIPTDTFDLSGHVTGWGGSLSSNIFFNKKKDVLRLQAVYGEGIQNYFNDAPVDVGAEFDLANRRTPLAGEALPIFGAVAYADFTLNSQFTSSVGWSMVNITNSDAQLPSAFHNGQYASANLLWTPVRNVMIGGEFQFGRRLNFSDDFHFEDYRLEFSFKYSFKQQIGGK
jgi:outer membrane DcaP-like protein